jgi:hypothetical protein
MAKKYNIKTVADAVNAVTKDNIDLFLTDFSECLSLAVTLKGAYKQQTGEEPAFAVMEEFTWTDDGTPGLTSITMKMETEENSVKKNEMEDFADFIDAGYWIKGANGLWYQKSDGNVDEGIKFEQLLSKYREQSKNNP